MSKRNVFWKIFGGWDGSIIVRAVFSPTRNLRNTPWQFTTYPPLWTSGHCNPKFLPPPQKKNWCCLRCLDEGSSLLGFCVLSVGKYLRNSLLPSCLHLQVLWSPIWLHKHCIWRSTVCGVPEGLILCICSLIRNVSCNSHRSNTVHERYVNRINELRVMTQTFNYNSWNVVTYI